MRPDDCDTGYGHHHDDDVMLRHPWRGVITDARPEHYGLRARPEHYGVYATHRLPYDATTDMLMSIIYARYTAKHRALVSL